jgi:stage III sporulation protein AH
MKGNKQKAIKTEENQDKKAHKMSASNRKKIFVICAMVVLLVVAAYLNVLLSKHNQEGGTNLQTDSEVSTATVFSAMKTDRDTVRAQTYSYLDSIINSETSSAEAKSAAEEKKLSLLEYSSEEVVLENLIKARGFSDVCVTMSTTNVNVLVQDSDLTAAEVAQILYVVTEETGRGATEVVIVPKS